MGAGRAPPLLSACRAGRTRDGQGRRQQVSRTVRPRVQMPGPRPDFIICLQGPIDRASLDPPRVFAAFSKIKSKG